MNDSIDVSIAVVTYNSADVIHGCLSGLCGHFDTCVIDNASTDRTIELAESVCSHVLIKRMPRNVGFGRAVNRVLESGDSRYVLVLNPDVVIKPDSVHTLLDAAETHRDALILGPCLFFPDGRAQRSFLPYHEAVEGQEYPIQVDQLLGAVMLLRRQEVLDLGGFDEALFLYGEDEDLCYRVTKSGGRVLLIPKANATHMYGASSSPSAVILAKKAWHLSWARVYVARKHVGIWSAIRYVIKVSGIYTLSAAWALGKGDWATAEECMNRVRGAHAALYGRSAFDNV